MCFQQDYESSPPPECNELNYLDIPAQTGDMRYSQETNASSLALDPPQQPQLLNLFHPQALNTTAAYAQDGSSYYQPSTHVPFGAVDVRSRLVSNTTTNPTGMAHTHSHRPPIAHPSHHITAREQYSQATPSFRRTSEHPSRSPTFPAAPLRRNPLSPTTSSLSGFGTPSNRMDAQYSNRGSQSNTPPLGPTQALGSLHYSDGAMTPVKADISGSIDKGFFFDDGEWTCYRRNYFACLCSFTLSPHYPNNALHFTTSDSSQPLQVLGFAMCISAIVADNDQHSIELVQHTPKRDKGPTSKPEKVALLPKQTAGHHPLGVYTDTSGMGTARGVYGNPLGGPQSNGQGLQCEHTFERIQFKQATQNNGKRRAAQQYYHLVIELFADTGAQRSEKYTRIAYRKSAKMIVRGRSPGHYQNDRRSSHSSGPGGSAGSLSYSSMGPMGDFPQNAMLGAGTTYTAGYDTRGGIYGVRHHDIPEETMVPSEEDKAIGTTKAYLYYPGGIYHETDQVDMFPHRSEPDTLLPQMVTSATEASGKPTAEYQADGAPRFFHPPTLMSNRQRCGLFEGKASSSGYYPAVTPHV